MFENTFIYAGRLCVGIVYIHNKLMSVRTIQTDNQTKRLLSATYHLKKIDNTQLFNKPHTTLIK